MTIFSGGQVYLDTLPPPRAWETELYQLVVCDKWMQKDHP